LPGTPEPNARRPREPALAGSGSLRPGSLYRAHARDDDGGRPAHPRRAIYRVCLVIDRFHVVKKLNEAVDEVRQEEWRQLEGEQKKVVKGLRWILGLSSLSRTRGDTRTLNALARSNRRIYRAWELKDEFEHFWSYSDVGSARSFLKRWMTRALRSRLPSMRKFVNTLRNYQENILTYIERALTNAPAEGINRLVKMAKDRASGYRGVEAVADMIYLLVGDLDIPAHIPSSLKSL
jgi:transposase